MTPLAARLLVACWLARQRADLDAHEYLVERLRRLRPGRDATRAIRQRWRDARVRQSPEARRMLREAEGWERQALAEDDARWEGVCRDALTHEGGCVTAETCEPATVNQTAAGSTPRTCRRGAR